MQLLDRTIGWTKEQWTVALHFYDKPCEKIEDFLACRIYWWAHWDNAPSSAQMYFTKPRAAHRDMTARLFAELAPLLRKRNTPSN